MSSLFKGKKQKTKTTNEPWAELQPYLKGAYAQAQNVFSKGAPEYYSGNTVAPMSQYTQDAYAGMAQRGSAGSPIVGQAKGVLSDTLSGKYLDAGNSAFQGALNAAIRPVQQQFNDVVMPGLNSDFSSAGRYGSGAHALASGDAAGQFANTVGDISSNMAYQNYGDERNRMQSAMQFAPTLANQDYIDLGMLGEAGAGMDAYEQAKIDADKARYDYNANKDMDYVAKYLGLLNANNYGTQTTTAPGLSPFQQVSGILGIGR